MAEGTIFTSVRAALEATRGTPINPTRILEMTGEGFVHEPNVATIRPQSSRGSYFDHYSATAGREMHRLTLPGNALSFNQLAWLGNFFFKGVTSGTGAGADKTYSFVPASAADDVKSGTFEWGYDTALSATQPGFRLPFVVGDELTITWDKGNLEGVPWTANFHSPKGISQITSFGGSPTALATTLMSPVNTQVYIDAATIGTTADNYVRSAAFHKTLPWTDLDTLNLTTAAQDTFRVQAPAWDLTLVRYFINDNELDRYNDKAVRKIRVRTTGPTLGGSTYLATLDCYGVLDSDGYRYTNLDGLKMEQLKYVPVYDSTAATDHSLTVVTAETSIT